MNIYFSGAHIFENVQKELSIDDDLSYSSIILVFSLIIGCAAEDLHHFLLTVVEISTIRESEWNAVESSLKKPKTNQSIDNFNESDIRTFTQFDRQELHILKDNFFGEYPTDTYIFKKNKFTFEETPCATWNQECHIKTPVMSLEEIGQHYQLVCQIYIS